MGKVRILSHRGIVRGGTTQNDAKAFAAALKNGFGLETDLRDCDGSVVISHDPPRASNPHMAFSEFVKTWRETSAPDAVLALNIKADGLCKLVSEEVKSLSPARYFFFDMSVPDSLHFLRAGLPVFGRVSEYEPAPQVNEGHQGIWLDCFKSEWFTMDDIKKLLNTFGRVAIVSPELHKRPHMQMWKALKQSELLDDPRLLVCTDFPDEMKELVESAN
jgi:hypothetical protein